MRALCFASLILAGCSFNFDRPSLIKDLRVLAIQAEPPVLVATSPAPQVELTALVVLPDDSSPDTSYRFSSCVVSTITRTGGLGGSGGFTPTSAARCTTDDPLDTDYDTQVSPLDQLGRDVPVPIALAGAIRPGTEGLQLAWQFELQVGPDAGGLYAVKTVNLNASLPAGEEANRNPVLSGLSIDGMEWPEDGGLSFAANSCDPSQRHSTVGDGGLACYHRITPIFDAGEAQSFTANDLTGTPTLRHENFTFSWFATEGRVENETTQYNPDDTTIVVNPRADRDGGYSSDWDEPDAGGPVTFWVVVRDGRGGESWQKRQLLLR